jgi:cytochrome c-type biogenesis protein CcmH/NrfF
MGIVLLWVLGVVLVMAVSATFYRAYRRSHDPPPQAQHPHRKPRRKRRPRRNH